MEIFTELYSPNDENVITKQNLEERKGEEGGKQRQDVKSTPNNLFEGNSNVNFSNL